MNSSWSGCWISWIRRSGSTFSVSADSLLVAQEARNKFLRLTDKVICVEDSHLMAVTADAVGRGFPRGGVPFRGYEGRDSDGAPGKEIRRKGGGDYPLPKSPLTDLSDSSVALRRPGEGPHGPGSLAAKTGQLYLVDLLHQGYFERNEQQCLENRKKPLLRWWTRCIDSESKFSRRNSESCGTAEEAYAICLIRFLSFLTKTGAGLEANIYKEERHGKKKNLFM